MIFWVFDCVSYGLAKYTEIEIELFFIGKWGIAS